MEGNFNDYKPLIYLFAVLCILFFRNKYFITSKAFNVVLPFLSLVLLHSIFFSFNPSWSLFEFSQWALIFTFIFITISRFSSNKIFSYIKFYFVAKGIYLILSSNYIFIQGLEANYIDDGQFHGLLTNSNMFAFSLVLSFPFIQQIINNKYVFGVLIINTLLLLFVSGSRGALLCFLIYFFLSIKNNSKVWQFVTLILIVTPIIYNFMDTSFIYKGNSNDVEGALSTRSHFWTARIEAIKAKPYFGWGYSVNEFNYFSEYVVTNIREKGNTVLALVEEFGLFLGLLVIFYTLRIFISSTKNHLNLGNPNIAYLLIVVLIHNQVETWLFNFNSIDTILVWFLVFIGMNLNKKNIYKYEN